MIILNIIYFFDKKYSILLSDALTTIIRKNVFPSENFEIAAEISNKRIK